MRRLLGERVANLRPFGECDDSRVEQSQLFSQGVEFGLLAEDDLAQLFKVVLQVSQQEFDVGQAVVSGRHWEKSTIRGERITGIGIRLTAIGRTRSLRRAS